MTTFWENKFLVSADTETTGVDTAVDRIVEIGFSIWHQGEEVGHWGTLVNPQQPIPEGASNIHGIYDDDVKDKPIFRDVIPDIMKYLSLGVLVVYNAPFDVPIITAELARCQLPYPNGPVIDPMVWFRKYEKWNKGKSLIAAAKRYGFSHIGAHRAFEDAHMSMQVLNHMYKTKPNMPKDLKTLLKKQREYAEAWWVEMNNYRRRKGLDLFDRPAFEVYEAGL